MVMVVRRKGGVEKEERKEKGKRNENVKKWKEIMFMYTFYEDLCFYHYYYY